LALTERCDLLVMAAFLPELAGLESTLGEQFSKSVRGLHVRAAPVGVGLVQAACGTMALLEKCQPRAVVLVGTCGAYPGSGLSIGEVVVAKSVSLVEPAVLEERAAFPAVMSSPLGAHGSLTAAIAGAGAPIVDVVTTLAITTDDKLAALLGSQGAVEHLEAFSVATACAKQEVPFLAVLGIANRVGRSGRTEWLANHDTAGRAAVGLVARWIEAGASKVPPPPA
jgi:futalosine hydrolase